MPTVVSRHQAGGTVRDGGVDDLALPGRSCLDQRGKHSRDEEQAAAAIIAHDIERHDRFLFIADRRQRARYRDEVDVVPGRPGQRSALPPPRDAPVDEPGVDRVTLLRTETESFGNTGTKAFQQGVCSFDESQECFQAERILDVERDRALAAGIDVVLRRNAEA